MGKCFFTSVFPVVGVSGLQSLSRRGTEVGSFYMNKAIASLSSLTIIANMADHKKQELFQYERKQSDRSVPDSNDDILNLFTEEEKKKLMWRIDVRLCLTLGLMYCVSLMDRYLLIPPNMEEVRLTSDNTAPTWALLW